MSMVSIACPDGHQLSAFYMKANGSSKGGIVLLQEIFGLTDYIQDIARYWADQGYDVLAPSLFDRHAPNTVIDYKKPETGLELVSLTDLSSILIDVKASGQWLRDSNAKVGLLGYCWGGGLAYRAACELSFDAAAIIYGTRLFDHAEYSPNCPVQFCFASRDKHYSDDIAFAMSKAAPRAQQVVYSADHGFDRNARTKEQQTTRESCRSLLLSFFGANL